MTTHKDEVREILSSLASLAADLGLASLARDTLETRVAKLDGNHFSLVVLGEFNHGKSTLVNALLGQALLPVGATPTTAVLALIRHGEEFAASAVFDSGKRIPITAADLSDRLRGGVGAPAASGDPEAPEAPQAPDDPIVRIEIALPSPFLKNRVTLVDTPGVNDLSEQRADVTHGYVPRADAIIFLLDATQVLTSSEQRFLRERVLAAVRDRLVFVVAKSDLLDAGERREVETFARAQLATVIGAPALFFVSARLALGGRAEESGLPGLIDHLDNVLGKDRDRVIVEHALDDAERLARFVRQSLGLRRAAFTLPRADLDEKIQRARRRQAEGPRALARAGETIDAETAAQKAQTAADLADLVAAVNGRLPAELAAAAAVDVERYLGPFIETTFKQWLAIEGDRVAAALDALAEKVVAMASETLDAEIEAVTRDLQPPDQDVSTPALAMEASVFALGALGSTALLFVSTMMGGALVLLTPAFAAVVRARAAREAKERAREQAPALVSAVAAEIGSRLVQVVDGFAARLRGFIAEAGDALARGVVEGLVHTRAERDREPTGSAFEERTRQLHARLKELEQRIIECRQAAPARPVATVAQ